MTQSQVIILLLCLNDELCFQIDYDKISNCLGYSAEEVTKLLSSLFQNNQISVSLQKNENGHCEVFDCTNLFVEIEPQKNSNVFHEIELIYGKSLSSNEANIISKWISINKFSESDILDAFSKAAINNVKNLKYIEKILESNLQNIAEENITPLTMDYNWLEDE